MFMFIHVHDVYDVYMYMFIHVHDVYMYMFVHVHCSSLQVLTIIFQYLKLLQKEGPQKRLVWLINYSLHSIIIVFRLFDEFRLIEENNFKFEEEVNKF